jgi:hypothetical protein
VSGAKGGGGHLLVGALDQIDCHRKLLPHPRFLGVAPNPLLPDAGPRILGPASLSSNLVEARIPEAPGRHADKWRDAKRVELTGDRPTVKGSLRSGPPCARPHSGHIRAENDSNRC